jgi:CRP/FNR family transcriptional regulator, cyclic AMP receptor protein
MSEAADHKIVRNSVLGSELTEEEAKQLAGIMGVQHYRDGEFLVKEGDKYRSLFLLAEGQLIVTSLNMQGEEKRVYTMKVGDCAGTRAFVKNTPRRATLRSSGATTVYTLTPEDLDGLVDVHPRAAFKVMCALFRVTHANLARMSQETEQLTNYITKTGGRY